MSSTIHRVNHEASNEEVQRSSVLTLPPGSQLPYLVWRRIIYFLSDDLPLLLMLSSLDHQLQDICRPHTSSFFQRISSAPHPLSKDWYYHSLVRLVLQRHVDPSSIFEFCYAEQYNGEPKFLPSATTRPGLQSPSTEQEVRQFDLLVKEAARASAFIPEDLGEEVCSRFRHGDRDAALVILLPMCRRLKLLEIPRNTPLCAALFRSVAQEYQRRGVQAKDARRAAADAALRDLEGRPWRGPLDLAGCLPFSELLFLHFHPEDDETSSPLIDLIPFMGIPSLHRIELVRILDDPFPGWLDSDVRCSCPEIYFALTAVTKRAVLAFAEGVNPPCEIRQWLTPLVDDDHEGSTWDRIVIERLADGSKKVQARLDFDNRGVGTDWVAWIIAGKMTDWKALHRKMVLTEEDGQLVEDD